MHVDGRSAKQGHNPVVEIYPEMSNNLTQCISRFGEWD